MVREAAATTELSGWLRMKGAAVRGWKRMHFRLRGRQLSYSKSAEGHAGAGIQLAGCAVSAALDGGGTEQNVVCIAHPERGTRMLACDSADSLRAWLAALQTAASGAASPHRRGSRAHPGAAELDVRDGAFAHLSRARLSNTLDELRAGALEASRLLLDDDGDERAAARSDPSPAGMPSHRKSPCEKGLAPALAHARAERDEARSHAAALLEQTHALERKWRMAESQADLLLKQCAEPGRVEAAQEAITALERERKETIRVSEERQALQRQATKLQLVIQDMQADAETKSRESTDSLLQLKLEHEQACATIVRQYENAAEETRTDLKQMASHAEDLASKLAKSERIRVQNCDLHHEEMRTVKASLAMEQEKKRMLEAEVKKLRKHCASSEPAHSCVVSPTNVSKEGRTKVRCKGCGELMHVSLDDRSTRERGRQQDSSTIGQKDMQSMQEEIDALKSALSLALEAEQEARKEAERFTLASQQACETLQDRIASQLTQVADAEAERAMAIAQHRHDSAKLEKDCAALESQIKASYSTCKKFHEECASALNDIRPTGVRLLRFDEVSAQSLPLLLEALLEWTVHHFRVLHAQCSRQREERQSLETELIEARTVRESEDIANRRAHSELLEAQSQVMKMTRAAEDQRAHYAKAWGELSQTRKRLQEVMAEKAQLETQVKAINQHFEELLQTDEEPEHKGILQGRPTSPTKAELAAVAAAARRAISPQKGNGTLASRSTSTKSSSTSRPMSTKPINYFKGVLTNKDLTPKTVFMSPAKQDLVRERQYLPEEYVWEDSVVRGVENGGPQRSREEAQCATGRKSAGASPRKAGGNAKYEIPLHRRAKAMGLTVRTTPSPIRHLHGAGPCV